ncbi:MAG TPA: PAS domain-containing hybrid sensor histidine kinase/response regulator [Xanthobacteraceae bacterium]|jgi:Na+/proline symporter/CheY-like chemotaxis protein
MLQGWVAIVIALAYIGFLFLVASYGDRRKGLVRSSRARLLIYPLSLAVYCTSWTFFGSVGVAARTGFDFLTIYIGPVLMVGLGWPLIVRIARLAKAQNITSVADFIAARYGKSQAVAATVALIAIVGMIPYIALQLKAVSASVETILAAGSAGNAAASPLVGDVALFVALLMAAFAVLFGTRHTDATEHQDGLMLAIAAESVIKLVAFLAVGAFVTFVMFPGPARLLADAWGNPQATAALTRLPQAAGFAAMTVLSLFAIVLLPRQFHVAIVENHSEAEIRRAAWLFPLYLVLINLFVMPIAVAGLLTFSPGGPDADMFVLALPLKAHSQLFAAIAFIGGLSAATAMVIVETVALAIMVSNDIVIPLALARRGSEAAEAGDVGAQLLTVRRIAIFAILLLAYVYYRSAGAAQLSAIGLLSFAAIAQLTPAVFAGLAWRRGTASGAIAGMTAGIVVWAYTLLLPSISDAGSVGAYILSNGPFGIGWLRPQGLFGLHLPPLVHGVALSLAANIAFYLVCSLLSRPTAIERLQADVFVPTSLTPMAPSFRLRRASVSIDELIATIARYLGEERTRESFASFAASRRLSLDPQAEADFQLLQYGEYLLASAIGAASSRLVLSLLLRKRTVSTEAALKLLDDANTAIHYNREILQTALDHVRQGIAVFDKDLALVCWNRQFGEIFDLPHALTRIGITLGEILRHIAKEGGHEADLDQQVAQGIIRYTSEAEPFLERIAARGLVIEVRADAMPGGGLVTTFTDITPSVKSAEALERANATLERRVRERTGELTRLNSELERAKGEADEANVSKTRFLAAASHDILQPLNAARLYITSLSERERAGDNGDLVQNIDASLEAVEEIFAALLDISRLDTGAMKAELTDFRIDELLHRLEVEFAPLAREKGLTLRFAPSTQSVRSDRRLLRRLLQNLISNAIKYTPRGGVLIGCRRRGSRLRIEVYDTGIGIPHAKRRAVFKEFHRLDHGARVARGVGLGLSIVERIARVLDCEVILKSKFGRGSRFSVAIPVATAAVDKPALAVVPGRSAAGSLIGTSVLCIDNEPSILDGMRVLLSGWGCRVLTATDLTTALATLAGSGVEPDGLLVDYHLDGGNGVGVITELRRRYGRDLPAILVTADRSVQVREEARAAGVQLLNKPVKPAALRALLAQWRVQRVAAE